MAELSARRMRQMLALLVLFVFALAAATYVFRKGMEKGDRTTHELLLRCVIIVTRRAASSARRRRGPM